MVAVEDEVCAALWPLNVAKAHVLASVTRRELIEELRFGIGAFVGIFIMNIVQRIAPTG